MNRNFGFGVIIEEISDETKTVSVQQRISDDTMLF